MYFAHLFRWFSVRARLRSHPQAMQLLSLHYCNPQSLQTTVCVWEWQDPPWDRTCALRLLRRLKKGHRTTELLWKLETMLQLPQLFAASVHYSRPCHVIPLGDSLHAYAVMGFPGCKAGLPYTVIRGFRLAVTLPPGAETMQFPDG